MALVDSNRRVLAHRVAGQEAEHQPYGGVVPEIAARAHVDRLAPLVEGVLADAGVTLADVDAIAATAGPGLIGGVMVGLVTGKALAHAANKPLVAVNHLEGHALSPRLTDAALEFPYLLLLVIIPVMGIVIGILMSKMVPLFRVMQIKIDRINGVLRENLAGIRVIRAFVRTEHEEQRFADANEDLTDTALRVTRLFALTMPSLMLIFNLSSVAIIWFGGHLVDSGDMQIGDLTAFLSYMMQILFSVMMAVMLMVMVPRAAASAERISAVLDTEPKVVDPEVPSEPAERVGVVEFRDVEFRYPGAEDPVLCDVNLTIRPGQTTAVVGSTGAGKTTLVNLIPRLYDVTGGQVLVDRVDVRDFAQEDLWSYLGLVPQKAFLFSGTVGSNVRFGQPEASDEQVWEALDVAQADFVREMPEGLDAPIDQGGTNVSGGQRQRLSIARALVRPCPIYVFDDSFSALDYATDARLRAALAKRTRQAAVIIVAQRVSTIRHADQIVVLRHGQVAERGTHQQLLAEDGLSGPRASHGQRQMRGRRRRDDDRLHVLVREHRLEGAHLGADRGRDGLRGRLHHVDDVFHARGGVPRNVTVPETVPPCVISGSFAVRGGKTGAWGFVWPQPPTKPRPRKRQEIAAARNARGRTDRGKLFVRMVRSTRSGSIGRPAAGRERRSPPSAMHPPSPLDIADDLLARARTKAAADGLTNIDVICADATALPAPESPYDALSCAFGVFFLPDMDNAVRGLLDQIPGGRIGVAVWHDGALADFSATFFEEVATLSGQPQPTAGVRSASDEPRPINRVETVPLITDWLTSLGVVEVRTQVLSLPVPCTDEFAWSMILGSGLRGALGGFSDDQREQLRRNFIQALSDKDIREVNCDTLIAVGGVP